MFVAKRSSFPRFKIIVMNRNSKNNLEVPLAPTFQMQVREPYLIFRMEKGDEKESQEIRGIWFHDGKERQTIVDVLDRIVKSLSFPEEKKPNQSAQPQRSAANQQVINKEKAAASLMAVLKIGGSAGSGSQTPQQKQQVQKAQEDSSVQNMVLDKKSLQLSLMSLLQEDRFLDLIHAQYLKVAKARANGGTPKK